MAHLVKAGKKRYLRTRDEVSLRNNKLTRKWLEVKLDLKLGIILASGFVDNGKNFKFQI